MRLRRRERGTLDFTALASREALRKINDCFINQWETPRSFTLADAQRIDDALKEPPAIDGTAIVRGSFFALKPGEKKRGPVKYKRRGRG